MLPLLPTLALLLFVFFSVESSVVGPRMGDLIIFILAGQSNMSGRGGVDKSGRWDHRVPSESRSSPSVLRLDARLHWVQATEPLHADIDVAKPCGVGPGLPFANAVIGAGGAGGVAVGLVPCAIGGTRIAEWGRGRRPYEEMVRRARAAEARGGGIAAVLWYQGESDTVTRSDAEAYKQRMESLVADLRSDLRRPQLLLIQVALASGEGNFTEMVRKSQLGINMSRVVSVDAKGLPLLSDGLHLTTDAQVRLGEMLADAYLNQSHVAYNAHELKHIAAL